MGRGTWHEGDIAPDTGDVVFCLMSLTRYSPRGQSVHENEPTMSDDQKW
jgi:hypothetical protein